MCKSTILNVAVIAISLLFWITHPLPWCVWNSWPRWARAWPCDLLQLTATVAADPNMEEIPHLQPKAELSQPTCGLTSDGYGCLLYALTFPGCYFTQHYCTWNRTKIFDHKFFFFLTKAQNNLVAMFGSQVHRFQPSLLVVFWRAFIVSVFPF